MIDFDKPYTSSFFSLHIKQKKEVMYMKMLTHSRVVHTKDLPDTVEILKKVCPRVLKTKCFNDNHLPFHTEVKCTEIGHMFEHLVLANLSTLYTARGIMNVVFNGQTNWDWHRDTRGTFHIYIKPVDKMPSITRDALFNAIYVTELIMKSRANTTVS